MRTEETRKDVGFPSIVIMRRPRYSDKSLVETDTDNLELIGSTGNPKHESIGNLRVGADLKAPGARKHAK